MYDGLRQSLSVASRRQSLLDGKLYGIEDRGVMTCTDAKSGDLLWQKRLGGDFSASPILANGHIYAFDETGKVIQSQHKEKGT